MGGSAFHLYITLVVKLELSAEEVGGRFVAYCEEKSGDGYVEVLLFVGAEVADYVSALHAVFAEESFGVAVV